MPYVFVENVRRYRDIATGRFVPRETVLAYTERLIDAGGSASDLLAELVIDETISAGEYIGRLRGELKSTFIQEYVLGVGGRARMTPRDWGHVGAMLKKQYAYLPGFQAAIENGLSLAQIRARARLYFDAAGEAYERGYAASFGLPPLPAYPRDGSTCCHNKCYCHWEITPLELAGDFDLRWIMDLTRDNCVTCIQRAASWGLQVRSGVLQPFTDIRLGDGSECDNDRVVAPDDDD